MQPKHSHYHEYLEMLLWNRPYVYMSFAWGQFNKEQNSFRALQICPGDPLLSHCLKFN